MSAYKQFNSQDIIVSPFEVNKSFTFLGGDTLTGSEVGINRLLGRDGNYLISGSQLTGAISSSQIPSVLLYDSIKQLYYTNYVSGSSGFLQSGVTSSVVIGANEEGNVLPAPGAPASIMALGSPCASFNNCIKLIILLEFQTLFFYTFYHLKFYRRYHHYILLFLYLLKLYEWFLHL